jgi:hypothetical protein
MGDKVKSLLKALIDDKPSLPVVPEHILKWALGLDNDSGSHHTTVSKEAEFRATASEAAVEKESKLKEMLHNGELAVQGGIGIGFVAYDGQAKKILNPWVSKNKDNE